MARRTVALAATLLVAASLVAVQPRAVHAAEFTDIGDSPFQKEIGWIASEGITQGCNPPDNTMYCPTDPVRRDQMASFLVRALDLPATATDYFTDDDESVHEPDINAIKLAGITQGCNPPTNDLYCPALSVRRDQMASFIARAMALPDPGDDHFTDDEGSVHEADINKMFEAEITFGCNPPDNDLYCPDQPVTREQMAAFLYRALTPVPHVSCDVSLALADEDPANAAAALGICIGLESAAWVLPDGTAPPPTPPSTYHIGHGLLADFGSNVAPHEGARMLGLSSGRARDAGDPNACGSLSCAKGYTNDQPAGWREGLNPACPIETAANDGVALQVTVDAPVWASAFSFDWTYYTFEYPEWVCTSYNDGAAVILDGSHKLIASDGYHVSSSSPMEVCAGCTLGTSELVGTGFDVWNDAGATGWQATTVPITPGMHTLVFTIWDTGDTAWDSTILFDNFQWLE